ncbi:hypothetical protein G6514_002460 [Epicoccum nigrum]|nr:hypothetical protein G6514_002460 [Epicoccum nigrum]
MLAPLYKSDYVAGLWVKDLVRLLAWYKDTATKPPTRDALTPYRAPTWSWASVDGEIRYSRAFVSPLEGPYVDDEDDLLRPPLAKVLGEPGDDRPIPSPDVEYLAYCLSEAVTTYPEDQFGEVTSGFVRIRVQALYRVTVDTTKWVRNQCFQVRIKGIGIVKQFTAYPDHSLETIEGDSLLMPLVEGEEEHPNDYPEMRGLFLERVDDEIYRRKGAWRIGGEYSAEGLGAEHYKVARMWFTRGAARLTDRIAAGLDGREFAGLWDGDAYTVKII